MKIQYQSFADEKSAAPYLQHLNAFFERVKSPTTEIEVATLSPPDHYAHRAMEIRCGYQAMRNAVHAERAGYDAFAIGHFQDSGLAEAKSLTSIPVVGLGETSMLHACTLGQKIGVITINPRFIPWHEEQILKYGLERRVVSVHAMDFTPGDFMKAFDSDEHYQKIKSAFSAQAKALIKNGIEVLLPAGGIPMLLLSKEPGFQVDGVPVLDGLSLLVKATEMAVDLRRLSGTAVSRAGAFVQPPVEVIDELLQIPSGI